MAVYLVCEGLRQGLDDRILDALVIQFHGLATVIEPAGGSKGHRAVRAFLERRLPSDMAVAIEDRDYRPRAAANATWANPAGDSFIWRLHEIENYLLRPRIVLELFADFRAKGAAWANSLPATEADVSALLQALAIPLLDDHAAQVLKEEIVRLINGVGSLSFGPLTPAPAAGRTRRRKRNGCRRCNRRRRGCVRRVPGLSHSRASGLRTLRPGTTHYSASSNLQLFCTRKIS